MKRKMLPSLTIPLIVISVLIALVPFNKLRLTKQLEKFTSQQISFPEGMIQVHDRQVDTNMIIKNTIPHLVYYISPERCSSCVIKSLYSKQKLIDLADSLQSAFDILVILSTPKDMDAIQKKALMHIPTCGIPVLFDFNADMPEVNWFPDDTRFHTFLVGTDGRPIFVGDPVSGERLWSLFNKTLNDLE